MASAGGYPSADVPASRAASGAPAPFAVTMDSLAAWIDHVDKILVRRGEKASLSDGQVQRDLRRIAAACRADPVLDDLMMDAMLHGPGDGDDPR